MNIFSRKNYVSLVIKNKYCEIFLELNRRSVALDNIKPNKFQTIAILNKLNIISRIVNIINILFKWY